MKMWRYLLFPISGIYGLITVMRNGLYDARIFKSSSFDMPVICVGNLSMGGTGKTPHTEYLIRLLQDEYNVATLSRGYGRRTSEFILAGENDNATTIGDEPFQYFRKFKNIKVAVEKKRVLGVLFILNQAEDVEVVVLDDAFQHRALKAGFNILLTDYNRPYFYDVLLPMGELRELRKGSGRADIIIVTKCPDQLDEQAMAEIKNKIDLNPDHIFFTKTVYKRIYSAYSNQDLQGSINQYEVLLVTGIAKPEPIENYLHQQGVNFKPIHFGDHHKFKKKDVQNISKKFDTFTDSKKIILTTEKDFSRMLLIPEFAAMPIYCLEIQIEFLNERKLFDDKILAYVRTNQRDSEVFAGEDEL